MNSPTALYRFKLTQPDQVYIDHFHECIEMWTKNLAQKIKQLSSLHKLIVIDVGAGAGYSLIAMAKLGLIKEAYLVDPNFKNWKKMLKSIGYDSKFFKDHSIHIIECDGRDPAIPYAQADVVIKTFNGWVQWADITPQFKNDCLLVSCIVDKDMGLQNSQQYTKAKGAIALDNSYGFYQKI